MVAETSEYLMYGLPQSLINRIVPFFKAIEKMKDQEGEESFIAECSISHTSKWHQNLFVLSLFSQCSKSAKSHGHYAKASG